MADEEKVKREPVNYLWTGLNWDFLRLLAQIAKYADAKYKSYAQYTNARLEGDKDPINHAIEHLTEFMAGAPHDHFGTREHQLAAAAYNIMMKYFELKVWGFKEYPILMKQRMYDLARQTLAAQGIEMTIDADGKIHHGGVIRSTQSNSDASPVAATAPVAVGVDWGEGLAHFFQRWTSGLAGGRDPGAIRRWKAMLWVVDQFEGVARTDDVILPLIDELKAAAMVQLGALATPENVEEQQVRMAALDTLRTKIPDMFPAKAVS